MMGAAASTAGHGSRVRQWVGRTLWTSSRALWRGLGAWRGSPPNAWSGWASRARDCHSFYVDNYDGFKVVAACDMGIYEGRPSDAQLQLREVFKVPKKAAEGTLAWSSLGAEQLGDRGLVGSARKLRRAVLGATLRILCAEPGEPRGSQELLSVVGKAMHSVQFCRPLPCLFDQLYREMSEGHIGSVWWPRTSC